MNKSDIHPIVFITGLLVLAAVMVAVGIVNTPSKTTTQSVPATCNYVVPVTVKDQVCNIRLPCTTLPEVPIDCTEVAR